MHKVEKVLQCRGEGGKDLWGRGSAPGRAENGIVGATGEFGVTFGDKAPETCNLNVFK